MTSILFLLICGAEFRVRSIEVTGNEYFKQSAITKIMLTKTKSLFRKGIFNENVFIGDVEAVENLYIYEGFISVSVEHTVRYDSSDMRVDINLEITEGKQHFVRTIDFQGNTVFAAESLAEKIKMKPGQIFDPRGVSVDNYIIRYSYDDLGYADVEVESKYRVDGESILVTHDISEGAKQYVGQIQILGLKHTDTSTVVRRLEIAHGELFRYANILESRRELYRLGVFLAIRTQVLDSEIPDHKDIQFLLTEKELISINIRAGYGTRDRIRLGLGFKHNNMFGRAYHGNLEGKLSFVEQRASADITVPRSLLLGANIGLGFFFKRLEEIGYKTQSLGGNFVTWFEIGSSELSAKYKVERINTSFEEGDSSRAEILHGIIVGWLLDKRDDPFYTTRGSYTNLGFEVSGIIFPSDVDYLRPTAQIRFYRPLASIIFGAAFRVGMVQPFAPTTEVPIYKRMYCGGSSSVRGYGERAIGPVDENDNPLGGRYLGEFSTEVRFPLYKIFGGVIFLDGGNIWQEYGEIPQGLRWGVGAGLRLRSFLGSIRLDYGLKLGRREGESAGSLHFAIGEAF